MKKKLLLATVASCLTAGAVVSQAQFENGALLPYGNLGLNWTTNQIIDVQSSVKEETGFKPFFDYYAVLLTNPYGGASQGTNYTHEMIYGVTGDLEKVLGWKGASLVVSGAYNAGGNLSNAIGNFFTVSESYVTDGGMFYELYLAQKVDFSWGDSATFRIGRLAMGDTFNTLPIFGYMVSGAFDCTPGAMFSSSPYTSSPIATMGFERSIQHSGGFKHKGGFVSDTAECRFSDMDGNRLADTVERRIYGDVPADVVADIRG